jgi:seryl-tRNA synthetase
MSTRFKKVVGTREQVWAGVAQKTSGGLRKKDLMISKSGKIVSKKASEAAKERMKSTICSYCFKLFKGEVKENKTERKLKEKKVKGASKKRVAELEKEIESLRKKAGRIAEREDRITKEVRDLLKQVSQKTREMVKMKKALRA